MTEINNSENSRPVGQLHQASKASDPSSKAIAQTSNATAHGAPVNIGAQKASVFKDCEIPQETLDLLRLANENPNLQGLRNFFNATGFNGSDMAKIAAKPALGFQAV